VEIKLDIPSPILLYSPKKEALINSTEVGIGDYITHFGCLFFQLFLRKAIIGKAVAFQRKVDRFRD
jgi:hypothetical protein